MMSLEDDVAHAGQCTLYVYQHLPVLKLVLQLQGEGILWSRSLKLF